MEFQLTTDLQQGLQVIDFNFEELKSELADRLTVYTGSVAIISPDALKLAKADRAKLNKVKDALKESKLSVKREYMKPYEAFEQKANELIGMVDKCAAGIDNSVKEYENAEKNEKLEKIVTFFNIAAKDLLGVLTFDRINNPRWLNATYKMAEIEAEISGTVNKLRDNIKVIQDMHLQYEQEVLAVLLDTLDMGAALAKKNRLEQQAEALKAVAPVKEPPAPPAPPAQAVQEVITSGYSQPVSEPEPLEQVDFRVWVTKAQKQALRAFLVSNDIKYGTVK